MNNQVRKFTILLCFILFIILINIKYNRHNKYNILCTKVYKNYNNINKNNYVNKKIPKIIHLTYMSKDLVPTKVFRNLKKYYGQSYVDKFNNIPVGAHKADFFRYCVLYIYGGVYMDIKLNLKMNMNLFVDHNTDGLLYTCLGDTQKFLKKRNLIIKLENKTKNILTTRHIFQAFIATFPKNRLMKSLISDFFKIPQSEVYYLFYTRQFFDLLISETGKDLIEGENYLSDQKVILFQEINKKMSKDNTIDRKFGYFNIVYNNKYISESRYSDFPWK